MEHTVRMNLELFQKNVAIIKSFAGDVVEVATKLKADGVERAEFYTLVSSSSEPNRILYQKNRPLKTACDVSNVAFLALTELLWGIATDGGTGNVLTISGGIDEHGLRVISLSLHSSSEEE